MVNDLDGPKEPPKDLAERMWRNNALRKKYKDKQMPVVAIVDPADVDYVNKKVHLDKNPPPEIATVVENKNKRLAGGFERTFLKEIREIMRSGRTEILKFN